MDEAKWQTGNLYVQMPGLCMRTCTTHPPRSCGHNFSLDFMPRYLKTVDRFNDMTVTGFVTASRAVDAIRGFFTDMYDAFVKVG